MQTAKTILEQIGGNKFIAMTGAKNFVGGENFLQFSIGSGAKNKSNKVKITLTTADLYEIEFFNIRGINIKEISKHEMIYADQLKTVFTEQTGFYTSL
jgi:hypothetical protein